MLLKFIHLAVFLVSAFSSFAVEELDILGTWVSIDSGDDYKDTKTCSFFEDGIITCEIEELGFTKSGWKEATTFSTEGAWHILGDQLTISEAISGSQTVSLFKINKVNISEMVFTKDSQKTIWKRISKKH